MFLFFFCANFNVQADVKIAKCDLAQYCSSQNDAINYALSKSNGDDVDVLLVNTVINRTSVIEVRKHDFGGTEFPGMVTITAEEVYVASNSGHNASADLVYFLEDPITSTLEEKSIIFDSINGRPTVPLSHFYLPPHHLNVRGASLFSINNEIESALDNYLQQHEAGLLDNVKLSGDIKIELAFKKVLAFEIGATFAGSEVSELEVFFKASQPEGEAPWGLIVKIKKNGQNDLITNITGVALIEDGKFVFVLPVKEDGTVDTEKLLGTEFRVSAEASHSSLRAWFASINFGINIDACSSINCTVTIIDLDYDDIEAP